MGNEVIQRKLYQIKKLLKDLRPLLDELEDEFLGKRTSVGASERDFQLIVNLAIDINGIIIVNAENQIPDTYYQSFLRLGKMGLIDEETATLLAESAKLRNILVHEYDFEEDPKKFYRSAKHMLPAYQKYIKAIFDFLEKTN